MSNCPNCGKKLIGSKTFCAYCGVKVDEAVSKDTAEMVCPSCSGPLKYIEKYDRYWCNSCKKYAPKDTGGDTDTVKEGIGSTGDTLVCPDCGSPLKFIEKYDRHWCDSCKKYAPGNIGKDGGAQSAADDGTKERNDGIGKDGMAPKSYNCPDCGASLRFVEQYDRYWCETCKRYPPKESLVEEGATEEKGPVCPDCGTLLKYVEKYDRYWCHKCKKYAPKDTVKAEENAVREDKATVDKEPPPPEVAGELELTCPVCSGPLKYIEKYDRYWCNNCKKYAPKR